MTSPSEFLDKWRAGRGKAVTAAGAPSVEPNSTAAEAEEGKAAAEVSAGGNWVTRAEYEASMAAVALALKELAEGSRDSFFTSGRYTQRLEQIAKAAAPSVGQALQRLVQEIGGHSSRGYGVDRGTGGNRW